MSEQGLLAEVKVADASGMQWVRAVNEKKYHEKRRAMLNKNYIPIIESILKNLS